MLCYSELVGCCHYLSISLSASYAFYREFVASWRGPQEGSLPAPLAYKMSFFNYSLCL